MGVHGTGSKQRLWRLEITPATEEGASILLIEGRLGHTTAAQFERAARSLLALGAADLVLDLSKVDYLSSAGLRVIEALSRELSERGGRLTLREPSVPARLALELAGRRPGHLPDDPITRLPNSDIL